MLTPRICPRCSWRLTQLEGVTGRISVCRRCGWSQVVLAVGCEFQQPTGTPKATEPSLKGR